uniref:Uncharacterized protein n=1 Tax=Arundo donax TaxID=35708 RepID=A0A0A9DPT4_ARUDO
MDFFVARGVAFWSDLVLPLLLDGWLIPTMSCRLCLWILSYLVSGGPSGCYWYIYYRSRLMMSSWNFFSCD